MDGKLHHRAGSALRMLAGAAGLCAGLGSLFLVPAVWLRWEADVASEQALQATGADLVTVQRGLRETMERFERVATRIKGQELVGDAVILNERLLRAEPFVAPAVGLTVVNNRGTQASSVPPAQASLLLSRLRDQVVPPPGQSALLGCGAGAAGSPGWPLVRSIEGSQDKVGGMVVSALPDAALRSLARVDRTGTSHSTVVLQTSAGCELLRDEPPVTAWKPDGLLLRFLLQHLWPGQGTDGQFTAKGSLANVGIVVSESGTDALALRGSLLERRVGPVVVAAACIAGLLTLLGVTTMAGVSWPGPTGRRNSHESVMPEQTGTCAYEVACRERDEALSDRDRVLAAVGHDIRTPMNSILGICELLIEGDLTVEQRKWLQRIRASCEALLAMTNGMLETTTGRAGGRAVHQEDVDVTSLVEEVGGVLRDRAQEKGLELSLEFDDSVLGFWRTDPTRLRQVIYNLGDNAIKYTAQGSVVIGASTTHDGAGAVRLFLQVTDTGAGIEPEEEGRIFERYQRGREEVARGQEGVGLGLTLCREVASLLGGKLSLESTPHVGSTFTLEVPVERAIAATPMGGPLAGRSALVVGFTEGMRHRVAAQLERLGMVVETTGDGYLASGHAERMAFKHSRLDLLVLDGALRSLAADAVLARVQSVGSVGKDLRSVVVANGALPASIEGRVDVVLAHPVEARRLEEAVSGLFGDGSILREVYLRAPSATPPRVLVVEDSRINQALFLERLNRAGFAAYGASNGREAVEAMHRGGFDVALMDVQMPEMDGLEATRTIRAAEHAGIRVPIVGMTAHTGPDIRSKCIAAGMDVVLHKPIEFAGLPLRLRQVIAAQKVFGGVEPSQASGTSGVEHVSREHLRLVVAEFGVERTRAFLVAFLGETEPNLVQLRSALDGSRWKEVGDLAHRMAGLSSSLGAVELSNTQLALEATAKEADGKKVGAALREVEDAWERTRTSIMPEFNQVCLGLARSSGTDASGATHSGSGERR